MANTHSVAEMMSFEAHCKNLNEDRPILSRAKCRPKNLVSGNIRYHSFSGSDF